MIVWLTWLVKVMALQVDVSSSSHCADLAKLHFSPVSSLALPVHDCSLFIPLHACVAMPHGTSRLYNLVSVFTVYTTSGLHAALGSVAISRRGLHLVV